MMNGYNIKKINTIYSYSFSFFDFALDQTIDIKHPL